MNIENAFGRWTLVGSVAVRAEIAFVGDEPDPNGVSDWLNGNDDDLAEKIDPTAGLEIEILPTGHFSERLTGKPKVYWFDAMGALSEVSPFSGEVIANEQGLYLRPDKIPSWATPVDGRYGKAVLRFDSGETKIADGIRVNGTHLIRTINVVTDELYLDRVIAVYERQD